MTVRSKTLAAATGALALAAVFAGVLAYRGTGTPAVVGASVGALLGAAGSVLEALLVGRALRTTRGPALGIVLGGFLARLVLLVGVSLVAEATKLFDGAAFALVFLGAFLASLPILGAAVAPRPAAAGGEAHG